MMCTTETFTFVGSGRALIKKKNICVCRTGMNEAQADYRNLIKAVPELRVSKLVGCKAVDYGTYDQRLKAHRRGRKSPAEMLSNPTDRAFLESRANYHKQSVRNILGLYAGLVSSFRPLHAKYLCHRFGATSVLDFCSGWGGRMLGAMSLGCQYTGIDTNHDLQEGYDRLFQVTGTQATMLWQPAETVDFTKLEYDFILTSPPFGDLEMYQNQPTYQNWEKQFLLPVVKGAFFSLKHGGWMALCIPYGLAKSIAQEIGQYDETVLLPIRSRQLGFNSKAEIVYCWHKK